MHHIELSTLEEVKDRQAKLTPAQAIQMLKDGNQRFVMKQTANHDLHSQIKMTAHGQYPIAAIVSCIDSRVPAEIIFDTAIGDIFNARVAGNFVNTDILGSLEFACKVAGSKAIVVLGHTQCGAVKGACDDVKLGNLTEMLEKLMPAVSSVTEITEDRNSSNSEFVQKVADSNVDHTIAVIRKKSPVLREMEGQGELRLVGAMYDVHTGKVTFR
jgi:carbonic anhydrase